MESINIQVTRQGECVKTIPADSVPTPFGRGAPIGMTEDGVLHAGFSTEGPGLESVLLTSSDGGKSWSGKRLDWWQFFDHKLDPESFQASFFVNRRSMQGDAFGVLRDGTLLWAFHENANLGEGVSNCYTIRSEDEGQTWSGPVLIDKQGFSGAGNNSNRITELPNGTVLWPVRLGGTADEIASADEMARIESAGEINPSEIVASYVFRSHDKGRTWVDPSPLPDWCWENTITCLSSGKLIASLRYQPLPSLETEWSENRKTVFFADSPDNGLTWEDFRPLRLSTNGLQELRHGQCHGEISELSDGTLIVTYDHRYPYHQQQVLARISKDNGQTWSAEIYNLTQAGGSILGSSQRGYGGGYASSVVLEDDTIVTITGTGNCLRWRVE